MSCMNCLYFKMRKGWKYAYCSIGWLDSLEAGKFKQRLFKWKVTSGILIKRSKNIKILNKKCRVFESMNDIIQEAKVPTSLNGLSLYFDLNPLYKTKDKLQTVLLK